MGGQFKVPVATRKADPALSIPNPFKGASLATSKADFANLAISAQNVRSNEVAVKDNDPVVTGVPVHQRWKIAADKALAHTAARKIRLNNKLRSLQRTPLHMVVQRVRQLVERRDAAVVQFATSPSTIAGSPKGMLAKRTSFANVPQSPRFANSQRQTPVKTAPGGPSSPTRVVSMKRTQSSVGITGGAIVMDEESILDELYVTVRFLATFFEKLPEDTCMDLCRHLRVETATKDQILVRPGDDATKFGIIIAGMVEKAASLRHEGRFNQNTAATLKKGEHFGSDCILKKEKHPYAYTALNHVTLLTVDREPFRLCFGKYTDKKRSMTAEFLSSYVAALDEVDEAGLKILAECAEEVQLEMGTEFDMISTEHLYVVVKGQANLMVPKQQSSTTKAERGKPRSSKARKETLFKLLHLDDEIDENGKYVNLTEDEIPIDVTIGETELISMHHGVAYSTFGKTFKRTLADTEENMKVIAQLGPGGYFGGGSFLQGQDPLLSDVKAFVVQDSLVYRLSSEALHHRIPEEVIQLLRNEIAFQLTYYMGRQGLLPLDRVIGHELASMFDKANKEHLQQARISSEAEQTRLYLSGRNKKTLSAFQQKRKALMATKAEYMRKANEKLPKQQDERTKFTNIRYKESKYPVGYVMHMKTTMESEHAQAMEDSLLTSKGTPVERYWNSSGWQAGHQTKMLPLLQAVFPLGLGPLAEKMERIQIQEKGDLLEAGVPVADTAWGQAGGGTEPSSPIRPPISPKPPESSPSPRGKAMLTMRPGRSPAGSAGDGRFFSSAPSPTWAAPATNLEAGQYDDSPDGRPCTAPMDTGKGVGSVRAASYLWDGMKGSRRPYLRQCLTFAEIAKVSNKNRERTRELFESRSKHDPEISQLKNWSVAKMLDETLQPPPLDNRPGTAP